MENRIYDENNGLWYVRQGDYYLSELALLPEEEKPIGIWGQRHLQYFKEHKQFVYLNLLTSGRLNEYLASVDKQAEDLFSRLVKEYADRQGVTERLKEENQLLWVQKMNNIRACVREVVESEVIYS
ncbi:TnpV protein [Roseburia sp. 1XD42-69]|uniref:TnpV protein n=1 Tax=Roseburia sp. 1XD42-69 TaxID=2320088 RepID=UPI000EA1B573|nr:TnpV protein [Roseburia sp. 1XD42-69]NBH99245.1 TnpV protein [Lachnospiraceae bacterium]NBI76435.1 TnpV protein [Lachnospiraceae bacterium]RKJ60193.1 TnpV protein [Roseburia sp. 1XD42-69]RKJ78435.1 TnpV protein [Anaerotruncus sp. 1XD22-93]